MASLFLPAPVRNKSRQTPNTNNNSSNASAGGSTALTTTAKRPLAGGVGANANANAKKAPKARAPSYEQRVRAAAEFSKLTPAQRKNRKPLFVPRSLADFDDGGSF
eukprot:1133957_1